MNKHTLPVLSYDYNALEPYISKEIMELHHGKHHLAYINNLNTALENYPKLAEKSIEDLLTDINLIPESIRTAVVNNGGGHLNHSMFWQVMTSPADLSAKALAPAEASAKAGPEGKLAEEISKSFGSFEKFKQKFEEVGLKIFGSGWVWLVRTPLRPNSAKATLGTQGSAGQAKLEIISTANQDNPLSYGHLPIIGNDVWEHAYYLQYKNVRADYLKAWWNVVNWEEVEKRFQS